MLTVTRYNPGRYPPGPRYPQFGDDGLDNAVDVARKHLEEKRKRFEHFHLQRLDMHHLMPYNLPSQVQQPSDQPEQHLPPPPVPPAPPHEHPPGREREPERAEEGERPIDTVAPHIGNTFANGATSSLSNAGAALVHGGTYIAGAAVGALGKGLFRGIAHLATGANPSDVPEDNERELEPEPLRAYPRPKAKASSSSSGSGSASASASARPFVDVTPYNGEVFDISDDDPPPAAASHRGPGFRQIAKKDVELARQTYDPNLGRGRRRG